MNRREVLLGAVSAVCARSEFNVPVDSFVGNQGVQPMEFAFGFIDDGESDLDKLATACVRALEQALKQHKVVGFRKTPQWFREETSGSTKYKLRTRVFVTL